MRWTCVEIGGKVNLDNVMGFVAATAIATPFCGVVRGLIAEGTAVSNDMITTCRLHDPPGRSSRSNPHIGRRPAPYLRQLTPATIDNLGLGSALQSYLRQWSRRSGIETTLHLSDNFDRLPEAIELSFFRIVQEGLSNV